jgi:predicted secreted Zn-dependent protease
MKKTNNKKQRRLSYRRFARLPNPKKYFLLPCLLLIFVAVSAHLFLTPEAIAKTDKNPTKSTANFAVKNLPPSAKAGGSSGGTEQGPSNPSQPTATQTTPTLPTVTASSCTKATAYTPAAATAIDTSTPGLKQVVDPALTYQVYGHSVSEVRAQINQCSPVSAFNSGEYDATTSWWLNTAYNAVQNSSGCTLANVSVGVHIKTLMPYWQPTAGDEPGLSDHWQSYVANLTVHETGHKNIAITEAAALLNGLQNFPVTDCGTIFQAAKSYGDTKIAQLSADENAYDTTTQHGANQGATFP